MNRILKKTLITMATAAAAIGLGVGPAAATSIWVSGGGPYTGTSAGNLVLRTGSLSVTCTGTISGTVFPGVYTPPASIGTVTSSTWSGCTLFGVPGSTLSFPSIVTQDSQWGLWVPFVSGGVVQAEIRNFRVTVWTPSMGCTLVFTGTEGGTWDNSTQVLSLPASPLTVSATGWCLGATSTGSSTATYNVSAYSPISIT